MKIRSKLLAVLGASVLTLGVAGVALATDLNEGQVGTALSNYFNEEECASWPADAPEIGPGEIGVHFVLTSPEGDSGNLSAEFSNPATSVGPIANYDSPAEILHFYVVIPGDGDTVIESASTDTDGNNLNVSHACPGEPVATPTFGGSPGGETDVASEPNTASLGTSGTSGPADGAWMLVVALGVLLASIVVLTPARAKSRR
jgi:hypothetical protein